MGVNTMKILPVYDERYKDRYAVSETGLIYRLDSAGGIIKKKVITPYLSGKKGYQFLQVNLYDGDNKRWHVSLAKLVLGTFKGFPADYIEQDGLINRRYYIRHIDGDNYNCELSNLEWSTDRSWKRLCPPSPNVRKHNGKVKVYCLENNTYYQSMAQCARHLHSNVTTVKRNLNNKDDKDKKKMYRCYTLIRVD